MTAAEKLATAGRNLMLARHTYRLRATAILIGQKPFKNALAAAVICFQIANRSPQPIL